MTTPSLDAEPLDVLILGDGLAGRAVAWATLQAARARQRPLTLELLAEPSLERASDVPGALMHPLPGRTLSAEPLTLWAYERSLDWLTQLQASDPSASWLALAPMCRPLMPGKLGARYRSTYLRGQDALPSRMTHALLSAPQALLAMPWLTPSIQGAIVYGPTCVVSGPGLLRRLGRQLPPTRPGRLLALTRKASPRGGSPRWVAHTDRGPRLARRVVLTLGAELGRWLPQAPVLVNGGELMVAAPSGALSHSVSAGGHLGTLPDGRWALGATYLRPDDEADPDSPLPARTDEQAAADILGLLSRSTPQVNDVTSWSIWRGRRAVSHPDRLPIAGPIPGHDGLYALGALGSKGLLWAPALAQALALALVEDDLSQLPAQTSPTRQLLAPQDPDTPKPHAWALGRAR